jgi:CHAD domain-containing protein
VRTGEIWTVDLPLPDGTGRRAIELAGVPRVPPKEAVDLLLGITRGERLRSLARTMPADDRTSEVVGRELGDHPSVGEVVTAASAASVRRYLTSEPYVRLGDDPEALHRARVAIRRLHAYLRIFRPVLDDPWASDLREELRWLIDVLGATRDLDVILARVRDGTPVAAAAGARATDAVIDAIAEARVRSAAELASTLRSARYLALLDRLVDAGRAPALRDTAGATGRKHLTPFVREPWQTLRSYERSVGAHPSDQRLHRLRIKTKRVRYAADALSPVFGDPALAFAEAAAELQDALGDAQDAVIVVGWLHRWAAVDGASRSAARGLADAVEHLGRRHEHWRSAWAALSAKKLRAWFS